MHRLSLDELCVRYGRAIAVDGVSFEAEGGSVTCLVGPNGAGKSSIFLGAYGAVPAIGSIRLDDEELGALSPAARARAGLAIVPQGRQLFHRLTVRENLQVYSDMLRLPRGAIGGAMDRFPILRARASQLAGVLSGGEQQMLVVARALMMSPAAILLDEIMTGLAPRIVDALIEVVGQLNAEGIAVVMAEPSIHAVRRVIDRGFVMVRGRFVDSTDAGGLDLDERYQRAMGVMERATVG